VPPRVADGALEPRWIWLRASLKLVRSALKPMVLTFAMSLAVTSSIIWWTLRPLIAANIPRIMGIASLLAAGFLSEVQPVRLVSFRG